MGFQKRGVSPVSATVLLVVFAIVLGIIIINWGAVLLSDEESLTEQDKICLIKTGLSVTDFGTGLRDGDSYITFKIQNRKDTVIQGMYIVLLAGNKMTMFETNQTIIPFNRILLQESISEDVYKELQQLHETEFIVYPIVSLEVAGSLINCFNHPINVPVFRS